MLQKKKCNLPMLDKVMSNCVIRDTVEAHMVLAYLQIIY